MIQTETSTTAAVADLRQRLRGRVLTATDPGYDQARRVWNDCIDRRPAVIARCAATADVVAAVRVASERDWQWRCAVGGIACPASPPVRTGS